MSTAAVDVPNETGSSRRGAANRTRTESAGPRNLERSFEIGVTEMTRDTVAGLRTLLPQALLRPSTGVDLVFDLLEQVVAASRRTALELASIADAAIEAVERAAA